jgi:hypothetical protein
MGEDEDAPLRWLPAVSPRNQRSRTWPNSRSPASERGGGASRGGLFSVVGLLALIAALFLLYLVSPFFTLGEYERTVVTRRPVQLGRRPRTALSRSLR